MVQSLHSNCAWEIHFTQLVFLHSVLTACRTSTTIVAFYRFGKGFDCSDFVIRFKYELYLFPFFEKLTKRVNAVIFSASFTCGPWKSVTIRRCSFCAATTSVAISPSISHSNRNVSPSKTVCIHFNSSIFMATTSKNCFLNEVFRLLDHKCKVQWIMDMHFLGKQFSVHPALLKCHKFEYLKRKWFKSLLVEVCWEREGVIEINFWTT